MLKISFLLCEINSKTLLFLFLKVLFKKLDLQIPSALNENVSLGFEFSLSDFFLSSISDLCYMFSCIHTYFGNIWWSSSSVFFFSSINCSVRSSTTASRLLAYFSMIDIMLSNMFGFLQISKTYFKRTGYYMVSITWSNIVWVMGQGSNTRNFKAEK